MSDDTVGRPLAESKVFHAVYDPASRQDLIDLMTNVMIAHTKTKQMEAVGVYFRSAGDDSGSVRMLLMLHPDEALGFAEEMIAIATSLGATRDR